MALLAMESNDIRNNVPASTWQACYASARSHNLLPIPENTSSGGVDQTSLKTYVQSTYPGDSQIDPSVGWQPAFVNKQEYVHPTQAGHRFLMHIIAKPGVFSGNYTTVYDNE